MKPNELPEALQRFIGLHIDSIATLEALLLLRSQPGQWSPESLARRLYIPPARTGVILANLAARQLCHQLSVQPPLYEYRPASPELQALVDQLADVYARDLIAVTQLVHRRSNGVQPFSDAFKLKQDPEP